jgi:tetratricopeptide (TPR) repeat protein
LAYSLKGGIYSLQLELDKSIDFKLKALEIMPNDPQLNVDVGRLLISRKDNMEFLIKGFNCLLKGADLRPKNEGVYFFNFGDLYFALGSYDLAEKNYLESYRRGYSCPGWLMYCHALNYQGKFRESAAFVDSVCVVQGEECNVHCANMKIYNAIGLDEYEMAEKLLEDKYRQGIRNLLFYDSLIFAHIYMNTGRLDQGREILSAMLENIDREAAKNGYQNFYSDLVSIYSLLNERETALQYLDSLTSRVVLLNERDYIINFPYYRNIREEPRFKILMERARKKNEEVRALVLDKNKVYPGLE